MEVSSKERVEGLSNTQAIIADTLHHYSHPPSDIMSKGLAINGNILLYFIIINKQYHYI
jgi:hypothetical protein